MNSFPIDVFQNTNLDFKKQNNVFQNTNLDFEGVFQNANPDPKKRRNKEYLLFKTRMQFSKHKYVSQGRNR